LAIAHQFSCKGLPLVCVPKTIDNDIVGTDSCFGFDSAAAFATDAIDRLHTTAEAHHRVVVVEVMGRYAGWIALHAGVAGGAHAVGSSD
jgi:ATP-dependent phosphofructokinase / diphosphate-dependent phosphofructokinase